MAGIKPQNKIKVRWSRKFAYAIGLMVTDGNLSIDGRHMSFTSKDKEQIIHLKECLNIKNKIEKKSNGSNNVKKYYQVQFGDVSFYKFLLTVGLMPAKSKVIHKVIVPKKYFFDFLRGHFDGEG